MMTIVKNDKPKRIIIEFDPGFTYDISDIQYAELDKKVEGGVDNIAYDITIRVIAGKVAVREPIVLAAPPAVSNELE